MKVAILSLSLLIASSFGGFAQASFQKRIFKSSNGDTLRYQVLFPVGYESGKSYPLVIFLHGAGERSSDNMLQLKHGSGMFLNPANQEKYPAIILFPQCPTSETWIGKDLPQRDDKGVVLWDQYQNPAIAPSLAKVKELIDAYSVNEKVDLKRIYILGISMGGMGTFDLAARYPDTFAAAVPICGGIYPPRLKEAAKKVKFRIFHGDDDPVVNVDGSRKAYAALRGYGAKVYYTEFPGATHNSWSPAFNTPDFLSWIFKQKKK